MLTNHRRLWTNLSLSLAFLVLSLIYIWPFAHHGIIYGSGDLMFHANRIEELYQDAKQGVFIPRISSYAFNQVGSGINFFYPWIFLYPFVFFRMLTNNPIIAFYCGIVLINFLTLWIAYSAMLKFAYSKVRAIIFAIIYTFSSYRLYLVFNQNVLAEVIAFTFIPLVLLGFYEVFFRDDSKWPILALGMTFLIYSHMLTTAFTAIFMLVTLVIFWYFIDEKSERLISAIKAAALSLVLSAFYLIPFIEQTLSNDLVASWRGLEFAQLPSDVIINSLDNSPYQFIGFILILTVMLGFVFWKNAGNVEQYAYLAGILLVIATTTIIPWDKFLDTPLSIIQFPYRLNGLATLLLSVYLSRIVHFWIVNGSDNYHVNKIILILLLSIIPVGLTFSASTQLISSRNKVPYLDKRPTARHYYPQKYGTSYNLRSSDWNNLLHYYAHNGSFDYFPKATSNEVITRIITHNARIGDRNRSLNGRITPKPNKIIYDLKGIKAGEKIILPVLYYHNDLVKVGNSSFQKPNVTKDRLIEVTIPKNNKLVIVKYQNSLIEKATVLISILTWASLIFIFLRKRVGRR